VLDEAFVFSEDVGEAGRFSTMSGLFSTLLGTAVTGVAIRV
jgi:hypothetical protein